MALIDIPVTNWPDETATVVLEDVVYKIRTRYNERASAWFADVSLEDGTLISTRKIVIGWAISGLREASADALPGILYATDTSANDEDPTVDDLGTRVLLRYLESTGW